MPTAASPSPGSSKLGPILTSPLFLVGAGAVVLIALISQRGGGGGSGSDVSGGTASALQQALQEQQTRLDADLKQQQDKLAADLAAQSDVSKAALASNATTLNTQLDLLRGQISSIKQDESAAASSNRADLANAQATTANTLSGFQAQLAELQGKVNQFLADFAHGGGGGSGSSGGSDSGATGSGPKPTDQQIRDWAQGLRPDNPGLAYDWGTKMVNAFGRLPSSIAELTDWLNKLGIPH